jgi:hypothetical protein
MDHTSINFIGSLTLMCDKSGSNYGSFMATAGMCMAGCTGDGKYILIQNKLFYLLIKSSRP